MSAFPQTTPMFLWQLDDDGRPMCVGRIIGWSVWDNGLSTTTHYCPVVATGRYGDGPHACIVDTEDGDYWTDDAPEELE